MRIVLELPISQGSPVVSTLPIPKVPKNHLSVLCSYNLFFLECRINEFAQYEAS